MFQLDTDSDDVMKDIKVGILTIEDDASTSFPTVISIAIVLEETIVLQDLPDVPTAFAYLFGLLYALNMEFPKDHKYFFKAIQHIFINVAHRV